MNELKKPKTKREFALWRAKAACRFGLEAFDGKGLPDGVTRTDYALFNLLHAVEDIAMAMEDAK